MCLSVKPTDNVEARKSTLMTPTETSACPALLTITRGTASLAALSKRPLPSLSRESLRMLSACYADNSQPRLGTNAVISTNDVDDDDDDDDDWFSPKGPPSGAEHGIKRPVKPIIKK
ncbi:hypothetical protein C8T65DRAFT_6654 [Cerioporus squamosus]|nr:hypothetical protein C8T65DRAFT_6654 [Cerioporus squamosus]